MQWTIALLTPINPQFSFNNFANYTLFLLNHLKASQTFYFILFFVFLGLHLRHVEVPRLEVELELQLPAYTTATATRDWNCVLNLHHSSWQCRILTPLSKARDGTRVLMDTSWVCYLGATMGILCHRHLKLKASPKNKSLLNNHSFLIITKKMKHSTI